MAKSTSGPHRISVKTPLGPDVLNLVAFDGYEEYSRLFKFSLEMFSEKANINPKDIVGKPVTVTIQHVDDKPRFFNGFVSRFFNVGTRDRGTQYRAEVVPWLWFLTRTADCRIFQNKTVPAIIEKIFSDLGFSDFKKKLKGKHEEWEYCVQYRETDFNFVSRLMEQEGIFFFFKHEDGKHTLVMADHTGAYEDAADDKVTMSSEVAGDLRNDNLLAWEHQYEYRPGAWQHTDYNFENPNNKKDPTYEIIEGHEKTVVDLERNKDFEIYDYPGEYETKSAGGGLAKIRMEEEEVPQDVVSGSSICRSFGPGMKFKVDKHTDKHEEGKGYVITSVAHAANIGGVGGGAANNYSNNFRCVPEKVVIRPARITPKPVIQGAQTAVVTGPDGEEIYPDKYGRVKVQFHWDREGAMDDKSSCWIRCMQFAAGRGWGSMSIPRVGQEVVVTFLEGDPDRPLISGLVYNAGQMPPYTLPDEKTKTYFKSNTSDGGDGHNEIRFEDKKNKEQVYLHAEKNMDVRVKQVSREIVLHDRHEIIGADDNDKGHFLQKIFKSKQISVVEHQLEHIEGHYALTVGKGEIDGGNLDLVIDKQKIESVGGDKHLTVGGNHNEAVTGKHSLKALDQHTKVDNSSALEAGSTVHIKAGMSCVIEAGVQLTLKVGGNFIDISPAGVAIKGSVVLINSGGAAGSGMGTSLNSPSGAAEAAPTDPDEADHTETGKKSCP